MGLAQKYRYEFSPEISKLDGVSSQEYPQQNDQKNVTLSPSWFIIIWRHYPGWIGDDHNPLNVGKTIINHPKIYPFL